MLVTLDVIVMEVKLVFRNALSPMLVVNGLIETLTKDAPTGTLPL